MDQGVIMHSISLKLHDKNETQALLMERESEAPQHDTLLSHFPPPISSKEDFSTQRKFEILPQRFSEINSLLDKLGLNEDRFDLNQTDLNVITNSFNGIAPLLDECRKLASKFSYKTSCILSHGDLFEISEFIRHKLFAYLTQLQALKSSFLNLIPTNPHKSIDFCILHVLFFMESKQPLILNLMDHLKKDTGKFVIKIPIPASFIQNESSTQDAKAHAKNATLSWEGLQIHLISFPPSIFTDKVESFFAISKKSSSSFIQDLGTPLFSGQSKNLYFCIHINTLKPHALLSLKGLDQPSHPDANKKAFEVELENWTTLLENNVPHIPQLNWYDLEISNYVICEKLDIDMANLALEVGCLQKHLTGTSIQSILTMLIETLCAIHALKLAHLDIKPNNVLLKLKTDKKENVFAVEDVKLTDFAFMLPEGAQNPQSLGTKIYMAPEVFRGEDVDLKSDIFSLGLTFIALSYGIIPLCPPSFDASMQENADGVIKTYLEESYQLMENDLEAFYLSRLSLKKERLGPLDELYIQMIHPIASKRPSALELHHNYCQLDFTDN